MLSVVINSYYVDHRNVKYRYSHSHNEANYAKCHGAECHYAECHGSNA
jgi:hypothetical protein